MDQRGAGVPGAVTTSVRRPFHPARGGDRTPVPWSDGSVAALESSGQPFEASQLAALLLGATRTRLGGLHVDHARRVAEAVGRTAEAVGRTAPHIVAAAWLHDVVEKTDVTADELRELVDAAVVDLVVVLTRHDDEAEADYLWRCACHPEALRIKRHDLLDKLVADDVDVPPSVAARLRVEALQRLRLLDRYAIDIADAARGASEDAPGDLPEPQR